jgi:hypothetical protein
MFNNAWDTLTASLDQVCGYIDQGNSYIFDDKNFVT